jgi:hypothetical protein
VRTEAPSKVGFQSDLIFSGFNDKYRLELHESIFNIVWFGEGRWSWQDIYEMPIFLRRFWIKKMQGIVKERNDARKASLQKQNKTPTSLPTNHRR